MLCPWTRDLALARGPPVKLCTYRRWFSRPAHQVCPVYWEIPMSTAELQRILRFRMGSHLLPIEQGRHLPKKEDYVSHLRASGTALAECERMVSAGDPAAAFAKLGGVLIDAARAAGCKHVSGSRPSRGMRRDKPYFDHANVGACERNSDMQ